MNEIEKFKKEIQSEELKCSNEKDCEQGYFAPCSCEIAWCVMRTQKGNCACPLRNSDKRERKN